MRSYVFPVALCAFLAGTSLQAQAMGSANSSAPTVSQSISFANGAALTIEYKSITWASGKTMSALMDAEKGANMRSRVNQQAERSPLGSVTVEKSVTLGGKTIDEGEYKMYFTIDDDNAWHLVMASEEAKHDWKLPLTEGDKMTTRLTMALMAGEKDTDANLMVAFGKQSCTVGCSASMEKAAASPGKR